MGRRVLSPNGVGAEGSTLAKDKIVEDVALEMAEGKWRPFKSVRELAARTGVSLSQAQRYAAEATRILRMSWGQDEAKVAVLERIAQIGRAAEERTEQAAVYNTASESIEIVELSKPDHRTALAAAKHLADMLGMSGVNGEVVVRYQHMTDAELWREAQRLMAKVGGSNDGIETSGEEVSDAERLEAERAERAEQAALDRLDAEDASRGR